MYDLLNLPKARATPLPDPKPRTNGHQPTAPPLQTSRYAPDVVTASSMGINMGDRMATEAFARSGIVQDALHRQLWDAYRKYDILRYCIDYGAHTISRVRWAPGYDPGTGDPIEDTSNDLVNAIIKDFANGAKSVGAYSGHAALGQRMGQHMLLVGEDFIHRTLGQDPISGEQVNQYTIYSTSELRRGGTYIEIVPMPGAPVRQLPLGPGIGELQRVWRPDAEYAELSSSPIDSILPLFEQLQDLRDALSAIDKSRISAGYTIFPSEMDWETHYPQFAADIDNPDQARSEAFVKGFLADFMRMQTTPVKDRKSAASVAAVGIQMKGDLIEKVRHINNTRESVEWDIKRLQVIVEAILRVLPLPPESLTGKKDLNHWTGWIISDDEYKALSPYVSLIMDPWTHILRQMLRKVGQPDWESWSVIPDPTGLLLKPDRSNNAILVFDRGGIGYAALRRETDFADTDAPTPEEQQTILAFKAGGVAAPPAGNAAAVQTGTPTAPAGITAAAAPPVDTEALAKFGQRLANIDRELRTKLETAGDIEVGLALKRIAGRVWNALPESEKRRLADHRGPELVAAVGVDAVRAMGIDVDALLAEYLGDYATRAEGWIMGAWRRVQNLLNNAVPTAPTADLQLGTGTVGKALALFKNGLIAEAQTELWAKPTEAPPANEWGVVTASVRPLVRRVLGVAGGEDLEDLEIEEAESGEVPRAGGLATGALVLGLIRRAVQAVAGGEDAPRMVMNPIYTWAHGDTDPPFPAHLGLDGQEFRSFDDPVLAVQPEDDWLGRDFYAPGDHKGCGCTYDLRFELEPA